ncbi:hypothetical protein PHYSODRAFT_337398 [Phytophthora sojae]|uniref:Fe2OG dioxygenase domain-containing protein n=1 Tax=Phytophthora sojae (strain P6497) TaxID=1094619 RepID=G5A0Y0_PHYSP|nr:hypothetical protein PHYSODRAFT_337398 [Phytophthora sojae]EGZ10612.1 hypothetical protein PHYSODRAFT_337398 [Phytophthora sojae]|eukprot:XP_009533357.1 hypothetical protein PHYSODRAFT_337398 [Phytophthora sojae]
MTKAYSIESDFEDSKWPFTGEGVFEDVLKPRGAGCTQVSKILARADEHAGEYSFGGLADTLPAISGLFVGSVGTIHTPLVADQAEKLIALCKKSPFGHNLDTKMDENVRRSWQLEANLVQFKNPSWQVGMDKLQKVIADRLGYTDVPLECVLYKLLVYGEGGHFVKHQDTEKEDGMIATLVVQPPSAHEGGDLAVYRDGELTYRHDFGKADGSAAFATHYAVHYADAEHALEEVTKGFRLVLVYSICLPSTMRHLKRTEDKRLSEDLAQAIASMGSEKKTSTKATSDEKPADTQDDMKDADDKSGDTKREEKDDDDDDDESYLAYEEDEDEDDSFALLLDHEYTMKSILSLGSEALKGIDRARLHALEGANALVAPVKKRRFFIAQLAHDVSFYDCGDYGSDEELCHRESMTWYSMTGEDLGQVKNSRQKLNLLNPGHETLLDLWTDSGVRTKEGGYTGNEGSTRITTYSRYAIVAWRVVDHAKKALKFMTIDAAAEALREQKPVDGAALRTLLDGATAKLKAENQIKEYGEEKEELSMMFREVVCDLLVDAGDPSVVNLFFNDHCGALGDLEGNGALVPSITKILRVYDWGQIGEAVLKALGKSDHGYLGGFSTLELILRLTDGLDAGTVRQALIDKAMQQITATNDEDLLESSSIGLLWKVAIDCGDKTLFDTVANRLKNADPSLLGPSIQYLSQYVNSADGNDEKVTLVAFVAPKRVQWLRDQIEVLEKPFSWEMREAEFPDNNEIQSFLRSAEGSMVIKGAEKKFNDLEEAKQFAARWMKEEQTMCSFEMEADETNGDAFVRITKTRDWSLKQQSHLVLYRKELRRLVDRDENSNGDDGDTKKRSRLD